MIRDQSFFAHKWGWWWWCKAASSSSSSRLLWSMMMMRMVTQFLYGKKLSHEGIEKKGFCFFIIILFLPFEIKVKLNKIVRIFCEHTYTSSWLIDSRACVCICLQMRFALHQQISFFTYADKDENFGVANAIFAVRHTDHGELGGTWTAIQQIDNLYSNRRRQRLDEKSINRYSI